jgi:hypothetical protein
MLKSGPIIPLNCFILKPEDTEFVHKPYILAVHNGKFYGLNSSKFGIITSFRCVEEGWFIKGKSNFYCVLVTPSYYK